MKSNSYFREAKIRYQIPPLNSSDSDLYYQEDMFHINKNPDDFNIKFMQDELLDFCMNSETKFNSFGKWESAFFKNLNEKRMKISKYIEDLNEQQMKFAKQGAIYDYYINENYYLKKYEFNLEFSSFHDMLLDYYLDIVHCKSSTPRNSTSSLDKLKNKAKYFLIAYYNSLKYVVKIYFALFFIFFAIFGTI